LTELELDKYEKIIGPFCIVHKPTNQFLEESSGYLYQRDKKDKGKSQYYFTPSVQYPGFGFVDVVNPNSFSGKVSELKLYKYGK